MDPIVTLEQVMATRPCYTRARIKALVGERTAMRLSEIMELEDVSAENRVWLAYRLDGWDWHAALTTTVERVVRTYAADCGIPEVELWAQRWLSGDDRSVKAAKAAEAVARNAISATRAVWSIWIASRTVCDASSASREIFGSRLASWVVTVEANKYESEYLLADILATLRTNKAASDNTNKETEG